MTGTGADAVRPPPRPLSPSVVACPACGHRNRVPAAASGTPRCGACHAALPWLAEAGDDDFGAVVDDASIPVLIDFWAPWCGPCRMVTPAVERLAQDRAGQLKLVKVNVDESPRVAGRFGVQSIPTLALVRGADELARQVGAAPEPTLRRWLSSVMPEPAAATPADGAGATSGERAASGPVP
ncbi:MAG: trx, partial [Acidimicrobiales bacterium]|nr:trx [Acidimicrobiales bacterium]